MISAFQWTKKKSDAALLLAEGVTQQEVASKLRVSDRTIRNWLAETEFRAEVDRLSLMIGVASRAYRLRMAQTIIREKTKSGIINSEKDLLDWLKFAQSETDGIKLDLSAAFLETVSSLAGGGQAGSPEKDARPSGARKRGATKSKASK